MSEKEECGKARDEKCDIEWFKIEAEHWYQGERQHEQRANWLLVLAIALIALIGPELVKIWCDVNMYAQVFIAFGLVALVAAIPLSLFALWPLAGAGTPLRFYRADRQNRSPVPETEYELFKDHYIKHKARAKARARHILLVLVALFCAFLFLALAGLVALVE